MRSKSYVKKSVDLQSAHFVSFWESLGSANIGELIPKWGCSFDILDDVAFDKLQV
jgi:hypothetical protein